MAQVPAEVARAHFMRGNSERSTKLNALAPFLVRLFPNPHFPATMLEEAVLLSEIR